MKRIFLMVSVFVLSAGITYAQPAGSTKPTAPAAPAAPVVSQASKVLGTQKMAGKVDSVSMGDAAKGTKSEIVIVDDSGKKSTMQVGSTTPVFDANWATITLDKIAKGQTVTVKCTSSSDGTLKATAINVMK